MAGRSAFVHWGLATRKSVGEGPEPGGARRAEPANLRPGRTAKGAGRRLDRRQTRRSVVHTSPRALQETPSQTQRVLTTLSEKRPSLELSTLDLAFLVTLQLDAARQGLSAFEEPQLVDVFERVVATIEPEADQLAARSTHTLRRLREQGLLTRVDGAGVRRAGQFALSRLASAIVDFYAEEDALTEHSLELLSESLLSSFSAVRRSALKATSRREWQTQVIGPLRITAGELLLGIERRQRTLDAQQERFQKEISSLLAAQWFDAIERCQALLDSTTQTLRQLSQLLLNYTQQFEELLQDMLEASIEGEVTEAEGVIQRVLGQVERMAGWGSTRQQAWSEYYESVHRYLRDVVRLDPSRAVAERLRRQLASPSESAGSLRVAAMPPLTVLRPQRPNIPETPVRRARPASQAPKTEVTEEPAGTVQSDPLESAVHRLLQEGVRELGELTERATAGLATDARFRQAGRVAELAATASRTQRKEHGRPWVPVAEELLIEQWHLEATAPAANTVSRPGQTPEGPHNPEPTAHSAPPGPAAARRQEGSTQASLPAPPPASEVRS